MVHDHLANDLSLKISSRRFWNFVSLVSLLNRNASILNESIVILRLSFMKKSKIFFYFPPISYKIRSQSRKFAPETMPLC